MRVLVLPRDGNPYQELLYGEMRQRGGRIHYLGELTPSHTLNLLLLPLELVFHRLGGARLVHLHWVFGFGLPFGRRVAQVWFGVVLRFVGLLGLRLVWTAHNVLPHRPVFADDAAARRLLVRRADLVISHTAVTSSGLESLGATPRHSVVIPHGPYPAPPLPSPGVAEGGRRFLFCGKVEEYKGVEELLAAFAALPPSLDAGLTVAGACADPALAARLQALADAAPGRITLWLTHLPDEALSGLFAEADAVVLPFREITTSGSALLALSHGRPLIVPDLAGLSDLPSAAVMRYDGSVAGLTAALHRLATADSATFAGMSEAALAHTRAPGWAEIAVKTMAEFSALTPADAPGRLGTWFRRLADDALYRGSLLLLLNTVFLSGLGFVFWALAARSYSASAVGLLAGVTAGVNLLATVAALGLPNTMLRHLVGTDNPRELTRVAVTAVTAVGGLLTLIGCVAILPFLPATSSGMDYRPGQIALVTALVVFTAAGSTLDAGLIAVRATGALLVKNLAGSIFKIMALFMLIPFGVSGLILAYGSGTITASVLGLVALRRRLSRGGPRRGFVPLLRRYLNFSAGSYLGTVLGILPSTVVPLEVLAIAGSKSTAWFAVAFQLSAFLSFIPSTMAQVLFAESQTTALRRGLRKAFKGIYSLLVPAVVTMLLIAPYVLHLFGAGYSENATTCLRFLALAVLVTGGTYLIDAALIARDRTTAYIFMNGANAALVLILVGVLLPQGLAAGALGWFIAQALSLALGALVLATSFNLPYPRRAR